MEEYLKCEYVSIMFKDDTVSDFTNARVTDAKDGIKIITQKGEYIFYNMDVLKGALYKPATD